MADKRKPKEGAGKSAPRPTRVTKAPRAIGPGWTLTDHEKRSFDNANGLSRMLSSLTPNVHPDDRDLLFNGLAAALSFHKLSNLIDSLAFDDDDELLRELEDIRVGFELALRGLDQALEVRAEGIGRARQMVANRWANDPKTESMGEIKREWLRMQAEDAKPLKAAAFARRMVLKYPDVNERSIQNAITRWKNDQPV